MKRIVTLFGLLCHAWLCSAAERPNIVVILLDDAGWTDVGCYGSRIQTPHIDQLAQDGMRFTDCHAAAPNCSPSRAGLLTGRIPPRAGIYSYIPEDHVMHLRSEEVTVAELLQDAGYRTGHFGKWHLSRLQSDQPGPLDQGFDYSLGTDNNASPNHHNPTNFIRNGEPTGKIEGYSCQIVVDEMLRWLTETQPPQSEKPFFACIWFHEPHTPIASPPDLVAKYQKLYPELSKKAATYHANIENVDQAVGRLLGKLDEMNLSKNTLVHLTSDNGPLNDFSHQGLRGKKSNVWEGGHRVPGIYRWPGHIPAGLLSSVPISGVDFLPTICELTGITPPTHRAIDGTSILSILTNSTQELERRTPLYWFFYRLNPAIGMRVGPWSLIANSTDSQRPKAHQLLREDMPHIRQSKPIQWQLFNLDRDLDQQQDLGAANPEILEKLKQQLDSLHRDVTTNGYQWDIPETYSKNRNRRLWNSK